MEVAEAICEYFDPSMGFLGAIGVAVEGNGDFGGVEVAFVCLTEEEKTVLGDDSEAFAGCEDTDTLFAENSRTCSNILEVSDVIEVFGVGFGDAWTEGWATAFGRSADEPGGEDFGACFAFVEAEEAAFDAADAIGLSIAVVEAVLGRFGAAFVDFVLAADFFFSGISISTKSEMTFLGLPLFLTTSADMLWDELVGVSRSQIKGLEIQEQMWGKGFAWLGS